MNTRRIFSAIFSDCAIVLGISKKAIVIRELLSSKTWVYQTNLKNITQTKIGPITAPLNEDFTQFAIFAEFL